MMRAAAVSWRLPIILALLLAPMALAAAGRGPSAARLPADVVLLEHLPKMSGYRLVEARADGTRRAVPGRLDCENSSPDLSPDGKSAVVISTAPNGLSVVSLADGHVTRIPAPPHGRFVGPPRWSPAEEQVVCTLDLRGNAIAEPPSAQLMIWEVGTGQLRPLTGPAASALDPAWSPDGKEVAFIGADGLETVSVGDGRRAVLAESAGQRYTYRSPSWSPDGRRLAFLKVLFATESGEPPPAVRSAVVTLDRATREAHVVHVTPRYGEYLVWSPDGRYLLLGSDTSGGAHNSQLDVETSVVEATTGREIPLRGARRFMGQSWSPRGDAILGVRVDEWSAAGAKLSWVVVTFPEGKQTTLRSVSGFEVNFLGGAAWVPRRADLRSPRAATSTGTQTKAVLP
jgi:Tol biopolymer transport system component